jgi:hypothetical protein
MPDIDQVAPADLEQLRPPGISESDWAVATLESSGLGVSDTRLMLLSADASFGTTGSTGSSTSTAIPFQQVYRSVSQVKNVHSLSPVSLWFQDITCFGFSPNVTVVCGSAASTVAHGPSGSKGSTNAAIAWRTNIAPAGNDLLANWNFMNLGVFGTVTSVKFVGYAWYISTWDSFALVDPQGNYQGQSSLFFASINFNAISSLDGWNSNQNTNFQVKSIDAIVPVSNICADGFEPSPANPSVCVKKCPSGFTPFGNLCVQVCPRPFSETGVPNECQPDTRAAKFTSGTSLGASPTTTAPYGAAGSDGGTNAPGTFFQIQWPIQSIIFSVMVLLIIMAIVMFVYFRSMQ